MDMLLRSPLQFEPLRKNRWIMRFPSDLGISEWMLKSAARPTINQKETEIQFLNTSTYVAGRYVFENIQATLRDFIAPSTSQSIAEWLRLCSEVVTGRQGYAAGYKRDIELEMLDPTGVCVQKWIIKNAWISVANFGSLDYGDDELADITITIRPDYCVLAY
jgi:hypothetical protein